MALDSRLKPTFEAAAKDKKVPGVAAIALDKSGEVLFKGAYGTTNLDDPSAPSLTSTTPIIIWSCTKLVTSVAALQLIEQGKLSLDDPVSKYVPRIKQIQVLDGFKEDGEPNFRAPKTKATILNLMTHTAGFSYDFFDADTLKWRQSAGQNPSEYIGVGATSNFESPLLFDPGTKYTYGVNTDWLGFVVEAISGMPLNEYVEKNIFGPLGITNSGSHIKAGEKLLVVHHRGEDGSLTANPAIVPAESPAHYGGGHFIIATLDDYSSFLLTILNGGTHPKSGAKILKEETVKDYLFEDQIHKICSNDNIGVIKTANPILSVEGEFLPGLEKGWSCGLMLNPEGSPKGRSAGSGSWAGLGNLYYWLDPKAGKLGLVMSGILPFMDKEVLHLFDELERAVYGHESAKEIGEVGGNWKSM